MQDFSQLYADLNYDASQLPKILQAQYLAPVFSDNTHNIWFLETEEGSKVLKKLNPQVIENPFWIEVKKLFGIQPAKYLAQQKELAKLLANLSPLQIPKINFAADALDEPRGRGGFILAEQLAGQENLQPDSQDFSKLVEHLLALESYQLASWGAWNNPEFSLTCWGEKLAESLSLTFAAKEFKDYWYLIDEAKNLQPEKASLTMLDLRWDQFLFEKNQLTSLVDLDAFVSAPSELNWIILELITSSVPLPVGGGFHPAPNISGLLDKRNGVEPVPYTPTCRELPMCCSENLNQVRDIYRLWLFSLNILGETDLAKWMARPSFF